MDEKHRPLKSQRFLELINLIQKAEYQIAAGDNEAIIALQYLNEELKQLTSGSFERKYYGGQTSPIHGTWFKFK